MRKNTILLVPIFSLAFGLTACNNQAQNDQTANTQGAAPPIHHRNVHDAAIIPSAHGPKVLSTNQYGSTYSGMGANTLSTIGSSSIHTAGISSNLESVLKNGGTDGVSVLVLDDTVIMGESDKHHRDGSHYDAMQSKLLTGYSGTSATEPMNPTGFTGTNGTSGSTSRGWNQVQSKQGSDAMHAKNATGLSSVQMAAQEVHRIFGGNVRVLTVNDPKALEAINRVKSNLKSAKTQSNVSADIAYIMKQAREVNVRATTNR
ncbi:hypothetical protein [Brevibacillus migulae]|uniref:hypothetical protein n=1 Tax=Brevibacillus migulae TaxID=1644114 RepID=UPI00106E944E|nr:hypothetical protein [Brevibacillus migulae]